MTEESYGASHPLDVERAKKIVSNRFSRTREATHKGLEDRANRIDKLTVANLNVVVDYLAYQHYMLVEMLASATAPNDAVGQLIVRGRIEQARVMGEEIAVLAEQKKHGAREEPEEEESE